MRPALRLASSILPCPLTWVNAALRTAALPAIGAALAMPIDMAALAAPGSTIGWGGATGSNVALAVVSA